MASIQKRTGPKGTKYKVVIRRKGHETVTATFRTKREAEAFAMKVEGDMNKYASLLGSELKRHTLTDLIDQYVAQWDGSDSNTLYRLGWWKDSYGDRSLSDFSKQTVLDGLNILRTTHALKMRGKELLPTDKLRSPSTINRFLAALGGCFSWAIKNGQYGLTINPCRDVSRGKETSRHGRHLKPDEQTALLAACDKSSWSGLGVLVRLALATGARKGELLGLNWSNVNEQSQVITLLATKNGEDRTVPVIPFAWEPLMKWKNPEEPNVFVFPSANDPTKQKEITSVWRTALKAAEIDDFRFHDLRHSCASFLAQNGVSTLQIGALLGHKTLAMVKRYSHQDTSEMAELLKGKLEPKLVGDSK
jgi:integrase